MQQIIERNAQRENAPGVLNARPYIALARGDNAPVLARFREPAVNCRPCNRHLVGRAYELLGQRDSAIAAYETFLTAPHWTRLNDQHMLWRPIVLVRTAELQEAAGNVARARELYAEFIALWEHADPELQPRVQAARDALARLSGDRR